MNLAEYHSEYSHSSSIIYVFVIVNTLTQLLFRQFCHVCLCSSALFLFLFLLFFFVPLATAAQQFLVVQLQLHAY